MTSSPERFALEAEQLLGTPFRFHGRDPESGLDCIGLAAAALAGAGIAARIPQGYTLRNLRIGGLVSHASASGFAPVGGTVLRGDLLLVRPGPAQHHLLVALGEDRFIHAHAGLGRVVIQTGLSGWPILHHWRLSAG